MPQVPQHILDALTRVDMPKGTPDHEAQDTVKVDGLSIPVHRSEAVVLGSGAAGLRAAVELKREGIDVLVASTGLFSGTSACSGSDKQTLHTVGTSNRGDNYVNLANDIGSGGAMDHDTSYIEAVGSVGAFAGLQYMGLPLPQDRFGAVLRYQTDHDEVGRATSCGPRTSRLMVKVLCEEAIRLGIPFLRRCQAIQLLKNSDGKSIGVLAVDMRDKTNDYGLVLLLAQATVIATGGPGELYRDSVYPKHCFGSLGMAIEAGLEVCNLTESQFGIGTRRTEFPWNLSGTYVQVIPYIYSIDADGKEHNFLGDYYRTTQELASNVFRKGYQWPFHATRMLDYKSSLVDLAIFRETQQGRTVVMDFNRNPEAVPGDQPFSLDRLDEDVRTYLENNDALQDSPIERLRCMNPLSIELYKMHGHDVGEEPLPFAVNNQHMNGGIAVDIWSQTSLNGCYAVGEVAGTHGVTRPGGAALNAGQVFGMRCAKHIKSWGPSCPESDAATQVNDQVARAIADIKHNFETGACDMAAVKDEIQARMSDKAGFICHVEDVEAALKESEALRHKIYSEGMKIGEARLVGDFFRWRQMALTSEALLKALDFYAKQGGGSRGARAMCDKQGTAAPETRLGALEDFRFIEEKDEHKHEKIVVTWNGAGFDVKTESLRDREDPSTIFFEKNWSNYLTDAIYEDGFKTP